MGLSRPPVSHMLSGHCFPLLRRTFQPYGSAWYPVGTTATNPSLQYHLTSYSHREPTKVTISHPRVNKCQPHRHIHSMPVTLTSAPGTELQGPVPSETTACMLLGRLSTVCYTSRDRRRAGQTRSVGLNPSPSPRGA